MQNPDDLDITDEITAKTAILFEIDGKYIPNARLDKSGEFTLGAHWGTNGRVENGVLVFKTTQPLYGLCIRFGELAIHGFYRHGEWGSNNRGEIIYRVWDRVI